MMSCSGSTEVKTYQAVEIEENTSEEGEEYDEGDIYDEVEFLAEAYGDLDKDGEDERVVVIDTDKVGDMGIIREIQIYKVVIGGWELWHTSTGAAMPSEHGGMMGDPFMEIEIVNGALVFHHSGGSREKWAYTHRFRFQNETWELIGASVLYGSACEGWEEFDYNLSNGNITLDFEPEYCSDNEGFDYAEESHKKFNIKPSSLLKMDGFYPGNNEIKLDSETTYYY